MPPRRRQAQSSSTTRMRPTCRKPKSRGCAPCAAAWRWALVVATAVTILLCINQQFSLRFFIGYTQLNTEYFYLLIALMLPFTFLIFPGTGERAARSHSLVRHPAFRR